MYSVVLRFRVRKGDTHYRYYKSWVLYESISVTLVDGNTITIPIGFETDLSSVPRWLWGIAPPFGNFVLAAIVHDYLYHTNYRESDLGARKARRLADDTMLSLSNKYNNSTLFKKADNYLRYAAVRLFGANIYKK